MNRRLSRRRWLLALFALLVAIACTGWWLWNRARTAPSWYAPADPANAEVVELAETVEYGVTEAFHRIRPVEETWTIRIHDRQLNAWLAVRLPEWIAHQPDLHWPREIGVPQVRIDESGVHVALEVRFDDRRQVLVTQLVPTVVDRQLHLEVARVGAGRLSLPGGAVGAVVEVVDRIAPGGVVEDGIARRLLAMLSEGGPLESSLDLPDGRRVELVDLQLDEGSVRLSSRTVR